MKLVLPFTSFARWSITGTKESGLRFGTVALAFRAFLTDGFGG